MVTYGCEAHWLKLRSDGIKENSTLSQIAEVQKFLSNHHKAHGMLLELGGKQS